MHATVLKTQYRISKLYYFRLGLIFGGAWFINAQHIEPAAQPIQPEVHFNKIGNAYCHYMAAGDAHVATNKYGLAERDYAAALLETRKFNAANFCLIDTMQSLGNTYLHQRKYKHAVAIFEKITALSEKTLPVHDVRLTEPLLDLAVSYAGVKQTAMAEKTFKRIISIWETAPAGWENNQSISVHNLASFYMQNGRQVDVMAVLIKLQPDNLILQVEGSRKTSSDPYHHYSKFSFTPTPRDAPEHDCAVPGRKF